jgi:hypothetical protein
LYAYCTGGEKGNGARHRQPPHSLGTPVQHPGPADTPLDMDGLAGFVCARHVRSRGATLFGAYVRDEPARTGARDKLGGWSLSSPPRSVAVCTGTGGAELLVLVHHATLQVKRTGACSVRAHVVETNAGLAT